jgi:hypothetical protein
VNPANSQNELYLADITGENQTPLLGPESYPAVDDHLYTLDGKTVIFSAVNNLPTPTPTVLERIFGIQVVSAHNVPSDWYAFRSQAAQSRA